MNITILTHGTRGDVQPFVALALGLQKAGHRVRLAAPPVRWLATLGLLLGHFQPFPAPDALDSLVVHPPPVPLQQGVMRR